MSEFQRQINKYKMHGAGMRQWLHYFRWKRSFVSGVNSMRDRQPWITFDAMDVLEKHLNPQSKVFEYGGGGSTLFFLDHANEVVTVEHNPEWFSILSEGLSESEKKRWKGLLVEAEPGKATEYPKAQEPLHYYTTDEHYLQCHFKSYAQLIDQFPDACFDIVLVDGRARPACLVHGMPKVKVGGLLVLDNSDRDYYLELTLPMIQGKFAPVISNQGASPYSVEFCRTSIWRRFG
jgi:hypothetical protein